MKTNARGPWLLPFVSASTAEQAIALGKGGVPLAMVRVPPASASPTAEAAAFAMAAGYAPMFSMLAGHWAAFEQCSKVNPATHRCSANRTMWATTAPMVFAASLDACSYQSDSLLRFQAFASLAFGARGIFWRGARQCAGLSSPKFNLLASINSRIASWGDVFVPSAKGGAGGNPDGYNITRLWTGGGWALPTTVAVSPPGSVRGGLVESMDDDVLVAELGAMGRYATPLIYVVNKAVSSTIGGAPVREIRVRLHDVVASSPLEGACAAGTCQCGAGIIGRDVVLRLPGGSGQLVALVMQNHTEIHPGFGGPNLSNSY